MTPDLNDNSTNRAHDDNVMNYHAWELSVPVTITGDSLWKMEAYRLALLVSDIGWHDVTKLSRDRRTLALSDQLYRALGSIGANLAEGYSRGSGKDRARFYQYALGSARESRDWYFKGRYVLGQLVVEHRIKLLTSIVRLLITMIPQQRGGTLREEEAEYQVAMVRSDENSAWGSTLEDLLASIPLPVTEDNI
jgi:four helix bundle protein